MKTSSLALQAIAMVCLMTIHGQAATVSFSRTIGSPSSAAIAVGVPPDEIYNSYYITTDADIVSFNQVRDRLNISFGPYQIAPPLGSDTEPPDPANFSINPGLEADAWITTPGPTLRTVFGNAGNFPGGDTWSDTTNDGPQTNFQFAHYAIPSDVNGFLEGSVTVAGPSGPETFPFSLLINFPFVVPELGTGTLASMSVSAVAVFRRRRSKCMHSRE